MKTNSIYFERHVEYDNSKLIQASELRRKVVQAIDYNNNGYDNCERYYSLLCDIMKGPTKVKNSILFIWNDCNSSCWKFEQLHILDLLSHWAHDKAVEKDPKEAKIWFKNAVSKELEAVKILNTYLWKDPSVSQLRIMQQRYHLARAMIYASDYYFNMYTFKELLAPVKKSYQMMELASRLWKQMDGGYDQLDTRHALCLKLTADELNDDRCGEKVALMEKALKMHNTDEMRQSYNLWKQQNDSVYYNEVKTDVEITCLSLSDSFQILLSISN